MSIDGFICGPNGEMDWMALPWTSDISQYVDEITRPVDCIILGRKLAEGFIPHWTAIAADPNNPEAEAGRKYAETPKVVFTRTLAESIWPHTTLAWGSVAEEVTALKEQEGGDIIVYGGREMVSSLLQEELIDELHLFFNPSAIGKGLSVFADLKSMARYQLDDTVKFDCGIVVLRYVKKDGQ